MRLIALERFEEPSRRCIHELIADDDDTVEVWDLHVPAAERHHDLVEAALLVWGWLTLPLGLTRRWRLLRGCLSMADHRRAALAAAPRWVRRLRADPPDQLVCVSARHFPLATVAAEAVGVPLREVLASSTQYLGEFAYELFAVIPYAHWLHEQGRLEWTVSTADTAALYHFSPRHLELPAARRFVSISELPVGEPHPRQYDRFGGMPSQLDTSRWSPPDYRSRYADPRFVFERPTAVICNKTSEERYLRAGFSVNHIETDVLLRLVAALVPHYTVVYDRPRATDIVNDDAPVFESDDIEAVKAAHPEVLTIQELHAIHPDLGFNELQLRVFAGCRAFVSVVGGSSYLASCFGGTNIVYARTCLELRLGAFRWFPELSGARVLPVATDDELLATVQRELVERP